MDILEEKLQVFKVLDFYLRDVEEIDKLSVIEDIVCEYTSTRNIDTRWIEIY